MKLKRLTLAAVSVALLLSTVNAQAADLPGRPEQGESDGNVVTEWNAIAQNAIVTVGAQPIQRSQLWMTLVHGAIYDAVTSISRDYEQFKVTPAHLRPASRDAAAIAAAHGILVRLLPSQQAALDAARENSLNTISDGVKKENGIAIGEEVASRLLEIHDGVIPTVSYTPGVGPGVWQPTPPAFANALLPGFAQVTPFALTSASQFRPGPPPALSSSVWTRDYNEVKAFGAATGSTSDGRANRDWAFLHRARSGPVQPRASAVRDRKRTGCSADRSLLCDGEHGDSRLSDRVLGRQISL